MKKALRVRFAGIQTMTDEKVIRLTKVLVTGAGGQLGLELCRQLKQAGYEVIALTKKDDEHCRSALSAVFVWPLSAGYRGQHSRVYVS